MTSLWHSDDPARWRAALADYDATIERQGVASLPGHDRWYQTELPAAIAARATPHVTHDELVRLTEWKMTRGVWRARNLVLVRGNAPALVRETSQAALAAAPHPTLPIKRLAELAGVGPATASAAAAAAFPDVYPFFDELVFAQIPGGAGPVKFSLGEYARYAEALRERAASLGGGWTPAMAERALWAHVGGKVGLTR